MLCFLLRWVLPRFLWLWLLTLFLKKQNPYNRTHVDLKRCKAWNHDATKCGMYIFCIHTWTPQQVVFGNHYLLKNHQKPPVGGYWYMHLRFFHLRSTREVGPVGLSLRSRHRIPKASSHGQSSIHTLELLSHCHITSCGSGWFMETNKWQKRIGKPIYFKRKPCFLCFCLFFSWVVKTCSFLKRLLLLRPWNHH